MLKRGTALFSTAAVALVAATETAALVESADSAAASLQVAVSIPQQRNNSKKMTWRCESIIKGGECVSSCLHSPGLNRQKGADMSVFHRPRTIAQHGVARATVGADFLPLRLGWSCWRTKK